MAHLLDVRAARLWSTSVARRLVLFGLLIIVPQIATAQNLGAIMPTGNSITDGDYSTDGLGFRNDLADLLNQAGVGFIYVGDTGPEPYLGHFLGGAEIQEFYPPWFGNGWGTGSFDIGPALATYSPNILLIHLGTNNLAGSPGPDGPYSLDGGETFLPNPSGYMAELLLYVTSFYEMSVRELPHIILSQIIPIEGQVSRVGQFNGYIEELALDMAYGQVTGSPVHVVICDHYTPFVQNPDLFTGEPGDYMHDTLHPNDLGYHVMAETYLATLLDNTPPGTVTDLSIWGQGHHSVKLWWTAPGDDHLSGQAGSVITRFLNEPITDDIFDLSWELVTPVASAPPGTGQQLIAHGLPGGRTYWLALKVADEMGNLSGVSNTPLVEIEPSDSLLWTFDEEHEPSLWTLGGYYRIADGVLGPANPQDIWLPPAVFTGEEAPWEAELEIEATAAPSELDRVGLVVLANTPTQATDGFVLFCSDGLLTLRSLQAGGLGATVDTATSTYGPLAPGERFGAIPFIYQGELFFRALRNRLPDGFLSTGVAAIQIPAPRYAGVIMRGGLGWGIESFRLGGPGLWESPIPFHLQSPDSSTIVEYPPLLVWQSASDPDPWDTVTYTVVWSHDSAFPSGETYEIPCGNDTTVLFPEEDFVLGDIHYWRVRVTDSTEQDTLSIEQLWWFQAATNHTPLPFALISPAHGESVMTSTPTLLWTTSYDPDQDDVVRYAVLVSGEADLEPPTVFQEGLTDTILQIGPLESMGPWYWSVVAQDIAGATAYADTGYFFIHSSDSDMKPRALVLGYPFPNPSPGKIAFQLLATARLSVKMDLIDFGGRTVASWNTDVMPGMGHVLWSLPADVGNGAYSLRISTAGHTGIYPVVLAR